MGKLVVEVNKKRYEAMDAVEDESVKRLLMAAIGELIVFTDGYETLVEDLFLGFSSTPCCARVTGSTSYVAGCVPTVTTLVLLLFQGFHGDTRGKGCGFIRSF